MSIGSDAGAPIAPPRTRILALVADLSTDLAAVDLDTIDGEFYWRCGRDDLLAQIASLYKTFPILPTPAPMWMPDDIFRYIGDGFAHAQQVIRLEIRASMLYPSVVWRRLLAGERIAMRLPEVFPFIRHVDEDEEPERTLHIQVYSGSWTGVDVEQAVAQSPHTVVIEVDPEDDTGQGATVAASINLSFAFVTDPNAGTQERPLGLTPRYPYVEITAPEPLPPPGAIGREYDAVVREFYKWHLRLPGAITSRQDKEVALRTWGVGLLVAAGTRFSEAMREVCEVGSLPEVSQTRFGQDRQRLVARVPEAEAVVYARD